MVNMSLPWLHSAVLSGLSESLSRTQQTSFRLDQSRKGIVFKEPRAQSPESRWSKLLMLSCFSCLPGCSHPLLLQPGWHTAVVPGACLEIANSTGQALWRSDCSVSLGGHCLPTIHLPAATPSSLWTFPGRGLSAGCSRGSSGGAGAPYHPG